MRESVRYLNGVTMVMSRSERVSHATGEDLRGKVNNASRVFVRLWPLHPQC